MEIGRFEEKDAQEVPALIAQTLRMVNIRDYSSEEIEILVNIFTSEIIAERARWTHFYVVCEGEKSVV